MQNYYEINDPHLQVWFKDWINVRPTGGESFRDQFERVSAFLQELKSQGKENVLLFCHGGVLACAKVIGGTIEMKDAFSKLEDYGSIIKIVVNK
jgi:alpha-ribazole phosphatase